MAANEGAERAPPKKRRRVVISCTECHRRKQKCDRELPCANCVSRKKADSCAYDDGAPTAKNQRKDSNSADNSPTHDAEPQTLSSRAADLGYSQAGTSSMGLLKRIEGADGGENTGVEGSSVGGNHTAIATKYKGLIRQLPSKTLMKRLAELYMRHFHWTYCFLEEVIFYEQLEEWNALPHSALSNPWSLSNEMRAFPALLFQVSSISLLVLTDEEDASDFEGLKYSSDMSWVDLSREYSETGMSVLRLFGKRHLALTTVEVQLVRALTMKYTADVAESWHSLAGAVRDAQELGLHRDALDPKPKDGSLESVLRCQWEIQMRRKLFVILIMWDVSCAMILGRSALMDWRSIPTLPEDVEVPPNRHKTPLIPRNPSKDPPTKFTRVLWLSHMGAILRDIYHLEQEGPFPKDFSKVAKLDERIIALQDQQPAFFRLKDPDTQWDTEEMKMSLQDSRFYFFQMTSFLVVALHRSYIFHRRESRDAALKACLNTLECHRGIFEDLPMSSWRNYMLFFGSFDAIVMVASIFIMFPKEQVEHREVALQHFRWTIERFSVMQSRNPLAKSALGVLQAVLGKFLKALGRTDAAVRDTTREIMKGAVSSANTISSATPETVGAETPSSFMSKAPASSSSTGFTPFTASPNEGVSSHGPPTGLELPGAVPDLMPLSTNGTGLMSGGGHDPLLAMPPLLATSDLVWNDLSVLGAENNGPISFGEDFSFDPNALDWQFGGEFGDDTVWGYLNQFQPAQSGQMPGQGQAKSEGQALA